MNLDPHRNSKADTGAKWTGLAAWAAENRGRVRRVVGVIKEGDHLEAPELTHDDIVDRVGL